jgi:hypothetical protein
VCRHLQFLAHGGDPFEPLEVGLKDLFVERFVAAVVHAGIDGERRGLVRDHVALEPAVAARRAVAADADISEGKLAFGEAADTPGLDIIAVQVLFGDAVAHDDDDDVAVFEEEKLAVVLLTPRHHHLFRGTARDGILELRSGVKGAINMTIQQIEERMIELIHQDPFTPFVLEMTDGQAVEVFRPEVAINGGGAGFIGRDGGLVDIDFNQVRTIRAGAAA